MILSHVRLFRGAIGLECVCMDENARPHHTDDVQQLLESGDITGIGWPAFYPDFNPIEHGGGGCFVETPCGTISSSGEHPTTETDAY
ncbi:hypothetical protein TNCV_4126061 [Trichonephila clavipes]|nr:hypothetical protein TNCV_4126061 [Trichonephila clavipes]